MIILLPTYKRTAVLPVILRNILEVDVRGIDDRLLLLIHNNYWEDREKIDAIVSDLPKNRCFDIKVVHREHVERIDKLFEALFSVAQENETIIFLGDDDLLAPWGIRNRYREINRLEGDFLLSHYVSRIFFYDDGHSCWPNFPKITIPQGNEQASEWCFTTEGHVHTTAIFNHCYRNTPTFRAGLQLGFSWCAKQTFCPPLFPSGLLPSYLPYTIQACGGKVLSLPEHSVIRGSIFEEAVKQDYADGGTSSFYSLLTLNTFSNPDLHADLQCYADLRKLYLQSLRAGLVENFGNRNVTLAMLQDGLKATGLRWSDLIGTESFNWRPLLRLLPFFRGWNLKKVNRDRTALVPTEQFLQQLRQRYEETSA